MGLIRNVGVLIFDHIELMDFAGPYEVFTAANEGETVFKVYTVGAVNKKIRSVNGLAVEADFGLEDAPRADVLVIPGGNGTRPLLTDRRVLSWIEQQSMAAEITLSICTGALLLAKIGLLKGLTATTHHTALGLLKELTPDTDVVSDRRYVDNGRIVTSAGISAGLDAAFHVVRRLAGDEAAVRGAEYMEYNEKG